MACRLETTSRPTAGSRDGALALTAPIAKDIVHQSKCFFARRDLEYNKLEANSIYKKRIMSVIGYQFAKFLVPKPLRSYVRKRFGWKWFRGDFASWNEACSQSDGYGTDAIAERVLAAARASRDGRAAWDRDGMAFHEPNVHQNLADVLRTCAAMDKGALRIVDFGGGLGGTWRQNKAVLSDLAGLRWGIVEQPHFVEIGNREFSNEVLSFHSTMAETFSTLAPTTILFSSVLQYLSNPHDILSETVRRGICHVIIDRTSFWKGRRHRLTVQHTPPELGGGSYPCWLFDRANLIEPLVKTYELSSEWRGFDDVDSDVQFHGMHFMRKPAAL